MVAWDGSGVLGVDWRNFFSFRRLYQIAKPVNGRMAIKKLAKKTMILPVSPKMAPTWVS